MEVHLSKRFALLKNKYNLLAMLFQKILNCAENVQWQSFRLNCVSKRVSLSYVAGREGRYQFMWIMLCSVHWGLFKDAITSPHERRDDGPRRLTPCEQQLS